MANEQRPFLGGPGAYPVRSVPPARIAAWLAAGWDDLRRCPGPGLLHGTAMAAWGALVLLLAHDRFWILAGAFSGFLIVAPLAATGLYAISRRLEREPRASLADALAIWRTVDRRLVHFGVLLALAGTGWVVTSASLVTGMASVPINTPLAFLRAVALGDGWLFEAWLMLGAVLAAPVFASSVVAIPLLLDRREEKSLDVLRAVLTSWRVVEASPLTMAMWAALLVALSLLGMALGLVGLVVIAPWLAHASWHAYRDTVATPGGAHDAEPQSR
ncbi:MAG: DUF2189 domain-containing protein [Rubrivivax sp.]|jgi:uncharacterized membrane protein|nr:DUF2189 domain-containing protein [Rubrivivax sp.]